MISFSSSSSGLHGDGAVGLDAGDRSPGELSEDEETREYQEYSSNEDVSDMEPLPGDDDQPPPRHHRSRKMRSSRPTFASRVRIRYTIRDASLMITEKPT